MTCCVHSACSMPVSPPVCPMVPGSSTADLGQDPSKIPGEVWEKKGGASGRPVPRALPEVEEPSAQEVAKHCLTHIPYIRLCMWCVAARMANFPHWSMPPFSRDRLLFVMDYCFLKHHDEETFPTVLVGRTYPSRAVLACPCSAKGADPYATRRLAALFQGVRDGQFHIHV